jgi:aminopeptidase YwaD
LWITSPTVKLIARLGADAALVAGGSQTADVTGELVYIPQTADIKTFLGAGDYRGKIALMWSHARGDVAQALDDAGIQAVISFSSRDRYFDPDQVVYSSGAYSTGKNLKIGFSVSWRQWSELMEDVEGGKKLTLRCKTRVEKKQDKFETVYSWIPGSEPDKKGVIFTAHLFEGYVKRGANDNMSGCVIQLEILRVLHKLIETGQLPQPRRNIYFVWPNEISGTYEFLKNNAGLTDKLSININMDMCGEGLRINNSWFTMSETPNHLPSYYDGLAKSVMNYVWRTNDIVYLPGAPAGRPGGQYFPIPMMEKNGSLDAFRFFIHEATGGSDHICFTNGSVAVPAIEYFTWPDYWYHADTDLPSKSDPTQMKRVAFIGAATAYAAANCTDDVVSGLADATSDFGYSRVADRELIKAIKYIELATPQTLNNEISKALTLVSFASDREIAALRSIEDIYSGSPEAKRILGNKILQWELYKKGLLNQVLEFGKLRGKELNVPISVPGKLSQEEKKYMSIRPAVHSDVKGKKFNISSDSNLNEFMSANPGHKGIKIARDRLASGLVLKYINGKRSTTEIKDCINAETGQTYDIVDIAGYLDLLREIGWII